MCDENSSKSKRDSDRFCLLDHANKLDDRKRPNPNRLLIGRLRSGARAERRDGPSRPGAKKPDTDRGRS